MARPRLPRRAALGAACVIAGWIAAASVQQGPGRALDERYHHLGNDRSKDWPEASVDPEGTRLELRFESTANAGEWTVFVEQRSVDGVWRLKANGVEVARLKPAPELVTRSYPLPAGALVAGENTLSFEPDDPTDDVVLGRVRLLEQSLRELHRSRPVRVRVRDAADRSLLPARVTVIDSHGALALILYGERPQTAVREGLIYMPEDGAVFELPVGTYSVHATRGPEWSVATQTLTLAEGGSAELELELRREVDTRGFVAADTHIHTLQFSGHGDASADERQVTLAGEGVELAIATDHNHNTDYAPFQRSLGLSRHFTAVVGNEVTTKVGHFNGFPFRASEPVPEHELEDYVKIVDGIRAKGAKVVILNHPRWPSHEDSPFGNHHLDALLGRFDPPLELTVDATEMINSTTEEPEPMALFRDWFALLNRGVRIFAVGSSDSHTVGDPVGQGRTYAPSASDDPARIDVDAACDAIKNGRTTIGMGLFASLRVDGSAGPGDTVSGAETLRFELRVQSPSWVRARNAQMFVNGVLREERAVPHTPNAPTDARLEFELAPLAHDAWVVFVASGDGVAAPFWPQLNDYTLAATNPVFVDVDGDGWQSARELAQHWVGAGASDDELRARLGSADSAVRVHVLDAALDALGADASRQAKAARLDALIGEGDALGERVREFRRRFE